MKEEIPYSEHATLVFELTSFPADVLGKLIKPGTKQGDETLHSNTRKLHVQHDVAHNLPTLEHCRSYKVLVTKSSKA